MDKNGLYYRQVQLLLQVLPFVAQEDCFALKGGTAINLFVRDLPRLSVDIDLVYCRENDRDEALTEIKQALTRISETITTKIIGCHVHSAFEDKSDSLRLIVSKAGVQIKIELSPVLRGTVYPVALMEVSEAVEEEFGYAEVPVVSLADLYAGKICAALDRQHPRDLFDVKLLLENEGLTEEIRKATLVYIISHQRPIAELLAPRCKDLKTIYENEFANMSEREVSLDELTAAFEQLVEELNQKLTADERAFLLSFKCSHSNGNQSDWSLLGLDNIEHLPAVRWKQQNLNRMKSEKRQQAIDKLRQVLNLD